MADDGPGRTRPEDEDSGGEADYEDGQDEQQSALAQRIEFLFEERMAAGMAVFGPDGGSDDDSDDSAAEDSESGRGGDYYMPLGAADGDDEDEGDATSSDTLEQDGATHERIPSARAPTFVVDRVDMSEADVEAVRDIMATIALPPVAFPEWSRLVAEEDWMPKIVYRGEQVDKRRVAER